MNYANARILSEYLAWDQANPRFYPLFKRFALELIASGKTRISAKLIFERIRWEALIQTVGNEFKLNNNYTAIYARRFMEDFPQHNGLFRLRVA